MRRQRLLAWERLVALASGLYAVRSGYEDNHQSWIQLRGVSYVRRAVIEGKNSPAFPMLKNQAGIGGVGTYWVTLVAGALVEDAPGSLTPRGELLADTFLRLRNTPNRANLRKVLAGDNLQFSSETLARWGEIANLDLSGASPRERRLLTDALLEPVEHRLVRAALRNSAEARSTDKGFILLHDGLLKQNDPRARRLAAVVAIARPFEALHAALLDCFDRMITADIHGQPIPLNVVAGLAGNPRPLADRWTALQISLNSHNEMLPPSVAAAMRAFLLAVKPAAKACDAMELTIELVRHHERVQAGKLDASRLPKQPWLKRVDDSLVVAPRFALDEVPAPRNEGEFTHPYRLESFAGMLDEVG